MMVLCPVPILNGDKYFKRTQMRCLLCVQQQCSVVVITRVMAVVAPV